MFLPLLLLPLLGQVLSCKLLAYRTVATSTSCTCTLTHTSLLLFLHTFTSSCSCASLSYFTLLCYYWLSFLKNSKEKVVLTPWMLKKPNLGKGLSVARLIYGLIKAGLGHSSKSQQGGNNITALESLL